QAPKGWVCRRASAVSPASDNRATAPGQASMRYIKLERAILMYSWCDQRRTTGAGRQESRMDALRSCVAIVTRICGLTEMASTDDETVRVDDDAQELNSGLVVPSVVIAWARGQHESVRAGTDRGSDLGTGRGPPEWPWRRSPAAALH